MGAAEAWLGLVGPGGAGRDRGRVRIRDIMRTDLEGWTGRGGNRHGGGRAGEEGARTCEGGGGGAKITRGAPSAGPFE